MKKAKLAATILCAMLAVVSVAGCGPGDNSTPAKSDTSQSDAAMPNYKAIKTDQKANKVTYLAVIQDAPVTDAQLEKVGNALITTAQSTTKAKNVFIEFTDTDVEGIPHTYGSMQTVNGKVTKNFRVDGKDWSKKPTEDDYKMYTLYSKFLQSNPKGSYDDFIASYSGAPSAADAKATVDKVQAWIS